MILLDKNVCTISRKKFIQLLLAKEENANIDEDENSPHSKTALRRRRINAKRLRPQKMVTGITFLPPSLSAENAADSEESRLGKVPCKHCGESYHLGLGMSSHMRWKHKDAVTQTVQFFKIKKK